jgi:hypothetical protein
MRKLFFIIAFLFAANVAPGARADSTTIDISATTCYGCFSTDVSIDLNAQLTLVPVTGTFYQSGTGFLFTGTEDEVTAMTGTLNGGAITLGEPPYGIGSWLNSSFELGTIYFTANGSSSWLENDGEYNLIEILDANGDGFGTNTPITWNVEVVSTPEPSGLILLAIGLFGLMFFSLHVAPRSWRRARAERNSEQVPG